MNAVYAFNVTDATPSDWFIDLKNGNGSLGSGQYDGKVDCTMTCSTSAFNAMISGELKPSAAFMTGKLKIKGNMSLGMKLGIIFLFLKLKVNKLIF